MCVDCEDGLCFLKYKSFDRSFLSNLILEDNLILYKFNFILEDYILLLALDTIDCTPLLYIYVCDFKSYAVLHYIFANKSINILIFLLNFIVIYAFQVYFSFVFNK